MPAGAVTEKAPKTGLFEIKGKKLTKGSGQMSKTKIRKAALPGQVKTGATILLHTRIAHTLFRGQEGEGTNKKYACFLQFASQLNTLWNCSLKDDPYADAQLIRIEKAMQAVSAALDQVNKMLDAKFSRLEAMGIMAEVGASDSPVAVELNFRTVHAAATVQLMARLDLAIRKALSLRHFGELDQNGWQEVRSLTVGPMRTLFSESRYQVSGVTRKDVVEGNAAAHRAAEKFGLVDTEILERKIKPSLGSRGG